MNNNFLVSIDYHKFCHVHEHSLLGEHCFEHTSTSLGLHLLLSLSSVSLLLLTLCFIFMSTTVISCRSRAKLQRELKQARDTVKGHTAANYEEIDQIIFTKENAAYSNVQEL